MSRPPVRVQAPPGGWGDAVRQEHPSEYGDLVDAAYQNAVLNENLNSEQEALEQAYDILIKRGSALGIEGLYNPYREDQSGEQRAPLGSAGRFLWQQPNDSMDGTPFGHESPGVRWKALEFENQWRSEVLRLGDKAEADGGWFEADLQAGSRLAVAQLSTTLRQDSLRRLEAIKEARGADFFSIDTLTEFGVGMGAAMNDPAQVLSLFVASPQAIGAKSVLVAGTKEAAVNASVEVLLQPGIQASKLDAGVIDNWQQAVGDGLSNVGIAGALGFTFGATGKLVDNKLFAPGRERTEAFRALARDIEGVSFNDDAVQRSVMRMVGDVIEAEGPVQPSQAMADALREAATKAGDPAAAARLSTVASEVERALQPEEDPDAKFERARGAMSALSRMTEDNDPESAAIVRKALYEAEKDYATARQRPDTVPMDEFAEAIEAADAQVRALQEFGARPEPALPEPTARALDTTDDAPSPAVGARLDEDGKPVTFTRFDPRRLGTAPEEFQYKRYSGQEGVNGAIEDVGVWHAPSSGKVMVFERADGEQIIADGHQRRGKAVALMARDGRDDIWLDGYLYKETDGWTVSDIRKKAAQKNIREGRSDVLDTAQALRESPDAIDASFPVSRSNIGQARKLARLSLEAWDLTRAGILEPQYAALIGAVAPDRPAMHAPLARTLIEAGPDNVRQAENIISEALMDYAERNVTEQPSLFGDDGLGRAVMYRERAQIMDATYAALRSERSVFKALVDNGDIARAIGNELVDQANLTAKDQVDLAIAAIMHARRSGVRTAVSDMISRALDSVRREGMSPTRAGQQVAREVRALVEAKGFRALLEADGPRPPEMAEAGPLFDSLNSPEHIAQADMLEMSLRPEGSETPNVDLAKIATIKDEAAKPSADPIKQAQTEFRQYLQAEDALRDALMGLTDAQKVDLVRIQYPDAFAQLNRMEGAELDDAIVGRVMAGEFKSARRAGGEITFKRFQSALLNASENKIVEMAMNGMPNLDIAVEMGFGVNSVQVILSRAQRKLRDGGEEVKIERGQSGPSIDGFAPGDMKRAVAEIMESGADPTQVLERLAARGINSTPNSVYKAVSRWRSAKRNGGKLAVGTNPEGMTPAEALTRLKGEFGDNAGALTRIGEVNIADIPPSWMAPNTQGITDAQGRVTLYSANVSPDALRGLVLHEIGVHAGLRRVLGDAGFEGVLAQIDARLADGDTTVANARSRVPVDTDPADIREETLAYLIQHAPRHGIVRQIIADIRAWLYTAFPQLRDSMTLTDADLQSLAMGAVRRRIQEADWSTPLARTKSGADYVEPTRASRGAAFSTSPIKYARRQDVERSREAGTSRNARGRNGAAGGAAGPRGDGAGAAATRGRAGVGSVQPVRAVASQPIPPPRFVQRDWNAAVDLTPQQRVERREQFREFVDSAEIQYEPTKFPTTWAFKNGKRYEGTLRIVETRRYGIRQTDDMHPQWREALEPEETGLTVEIHGKEATIHDSNVAFELRSTGIGQKIYTRAIDDMLAQGLVVNSDVSLSGNAVALWKSLRKRGYDVVQRVPDALLELGDDGQYAHPNSSTAVFFIAGKKPRAPDLPATERDVMNSIDEERALTDHMPKCLKGKRNG